MLKMVNCLVRRDDLTHEAFVERWTGPHAELAKQLPGLRKYATSVPTDPQRSAYDGEIGRRVTADAAEFVDRDAGPTLYVEETVRLDRTDEDRAGGAPRNDADGGD